MCKLLSAQIWCSPCVQMPAFYKPNYEAIRSDLILKLEIGTIEYCSE